ncbi:MAG: AmmeMemoRadiSam system radical SAM enzyme [Candidatus Auribacterota bacterium]|nr:AmmeMemoRadiSam system radical SAM enzyme [Candidatus Auribacterota bacterium]
MREKEALFGIKEGNKVRCTLCPYRCLLSENSVGICKTRKNSNGKLVTLIYGCVSSLALDPIEKKPLYHFYPGKDILSAGTVGCNFHCPYCQNWQISQNVKTPCRYIPPEELVNRAVEQNSMGIAYTYSEPLIWYEYVRDSASLCKEKELKNVLVTNGYIEPKPLGELLPLIDAMNIDIKSFSEDFYKRLCGGSLKPVLNTIKLSSRQCHVELTNLLIPGENDSVQEIEEMCRWIKKEIGKDTPFHISRYFPNYKFEVPFTPGTILERAYSIAKKHLSYVYIGNAYLPGASDTKCPSCGEILVERSGYNTKIVSVKDNKCLKCGQKIKIIMDK